MSPLGCIWLVCPGRQGPEPSLTVGAVDLGGSSLEVTFVPDDAESPEAQGAFDPGLSLSVCEHLGSQMHDQPDASGHVSMSRNCQPCVHVFLRSLYAQTHTMTVNMVLSCPTCIAVTAKNMASRFSQPCAQQPWSKQ